MRVFNRMKEPIFIKESSNAEKQIEKLRELEPFLNQEGQAIIRQDIKCLEYGIAGEKNIAFELKNSYMPMYILHDIYLEHEDLGSQIDYLVFTNKMCFVIECKNLYGDIEINNAGNFIRTIEFGSRIKKEGIYSPITQNQRHLELMKKIKTETKSNILTKFMTEKYFEDFNKSIVVLANPKTILNTKYATKEVKDKVIRADQLVKYIKDMYNNSKESASSDKKMMEWAQFYLDLHKEVKVDYTKKYEQYKINSNIPEGSEEMNKTSEDRSNLVEEEVPMEESDIFKELREFRLKKSSEENVKPYFIYNNNQLKDLILKMPRNKEELKLVKGFGEVKANKYGDDIIDIMGKYYK